MITLIDPSRFRRTPWKNGGGITVDIAEQGDVWRFGRTPITESGPFSDYTGFDRLQVLVAGRGLVLETPEGELDLRTPFKPVHFSGDTAVTSRLEAGPVEVVNLIGDRTTVRLALAVLGEGSTLGVDAGTHLVYTPQGAATLEIDGKPEELALDHCLRIEASGPTMIACTGGIFLLGSVTCV
ncbi:MAG: HutD family protein [Enhydrobacter sp.]|nr:HutD family protein [Enhydrobacter sp.]